MRLTLAQAGSTPQQIAGTAGGGGAGAGRGGERTSGAQSYASLVAPFSGTVQNLTAQVGQVVSPGAPVLSLINNSGFKIEAYVSETDVANIKAAIRRMSRLMHLARARYSRRRSRRSMRRRPR